MNETKTNWDVLALAFCTLAVTVCLFFMQGTGDVSCWLAWMNNSLTHGIVGGYQVTHDNYPPFTILILWFVGKTALWFGVSQFIALKCSLIAFLGATVFCAWRWTRNIQLALIVYLVFALNAIGLGYTDIYFAPSLVLCLWALQQRRWFTFSVLFAVTALIKYQILIFAPFFAVYVFSQAREMRSIRVLAVSFLPALALCVLCYGA